MVSIKIKEATKQAHQELEKTVVLQLKAVRNQSDYAEVLKNFYAYFQAVEKAIAPFIDKDSLPDIAERRNSSYIREDIEELGSDTSTLPTAIPPVITNLQQAFGALYVLEGSIMGGPYIVQMLQKYGMTKGFHFFSGYGADSSKMWAAFTAVLNRVPKTEEEESTMVETANETFQKFGQVFASSALADS
ncbi:biliverdin-producing heme oxygenase [Sphingobacterium faecale]|uniref:Biliverdin-producing heme oxygenase n=1 Tax=Sphingobacterium faecale TaxID=2803775 RepID=A0ABS1QXU5_9SPHI|nr:biliverdin-producing heme oxygenase [Sphingobacterium faecale]MBL1407255.1 biliverdin-producing heme oxygenase [Sphingobacterium faecale]